MDEIWVKVRYCQSPVMLWWMVGEQNPIRTHEQYKQDNRVAADLAMLGDQLDDDLRVVSKQISEMRLRHRDRLARLVLRPARAFLAVLRRAPNSSQSV